MSTTTTRERAEVPRARLARRLVNTALGLVLIVVGVVYAGTLLQTHAGFPPCQRTVDDSISQDGHATMMLFPPEVRCSYPSDQSMGVSGARDAHFAAFWVVILGFFALFLVPSLLLAAGWGENEPHTDR